MPDWRAGRLARQRVVHCRRPVMNEEGLRYEDEFVRHKMLDALGDLYLAGGALIGSSAAVRSGHALKPPAVGGAVRPTPPPGASPA